VFDLNRSGAMSSERSAAPTYRPRPAGTRGRTLSLASDEHALARVRPCLEAALDNAGWTGSARTDVLVSAGEAIVNAVIHGSAPGASIGVVFSVCPWLVRISVVDQGGQNKLVMWPPALPSDDSTNGRGLVMIEAMASRVEVSHWGAGTRVTMEFDRAEASALRAA
jgi:anti-sigma regulatory factor (Ser/Thr protein kinase)